MQRAIMGDCVAWKPLIAPHATVIKSMGQIGRSSGCMPVEIVQSGMMPPSVIKRAANMEPAMRTKQTANAG